MSLESLIAKTRNATNAATDAAVLQANQSMESGLGDLQTEQAEINPYYNSLINETNKNFETTLGNTRSSAASRGAFWGSGGLSNQELSLGKEQASKLSEYGAERTRKLADISRRRSLLKKQTADSVNSIRAKGRADLELTIADMRYKEYVRKQEAAQRAAESRANRLSVSDQLKLNGLTGRQGYQDDLSSLGEVMLKSGLTREQAAAKLYNIYGPSTGLKLQDILKDVKTSYGNGWESGYYSTNRSLFGKGKNKTGLSDRYRTIILGQRGV